MKLPQKIRERIEFPREYDGCWLWRGSMSRGYGQFRQNGKWLRAHRVVYEILMHALDDDEILHHTCRVKHCVAPGHLIVISRQIHMGFHRGQIPWNKDKPVCAQGHPLSGENLYTAPDGKHGCRKCRRRRVREWNARRAASRA